MSAAFTIRNERIISAPVIKDPYHVTYLKDNTSIINYTLQSDVNELNNISLINKIFVKVSFAGKKLKNIDFSGCTFEDVDFTNTELDSCNFTGINLISWTILGTTCFFNCELNNIDFRNNKQTLGELNEDGSYNIGSGLNTYEEPIKIDAETGTLSEYINVINYRVLYFKLWMTNVFFIMWIRSTQFYYCDLTDSIFKNFYNWTD